LTSLPWMRQTPLQIDRGSRTVRKTFIALVLFSLAACGRPPPKAETAAPTTEPTPEQGYAGVVEMPPASPSPIGATEPSGDVKAPEQVNMDAADAENQAIKTEVLARIDLMPQLTPEEKDKLYVQVERARGMGRIVTIPSRQERRR
jgi:predicted small lipoprotein YifL